MLTHKFVSLAMVSTVLLLLTGIANANDIKVKTGNLQVSVQDETVTVQTSTSRREPPSLLERLRIWRPHSSRLPPTSTSGRCQTTNSSHQSNRTSSSGNGVVQSSSSSSSTVCN